MSIGFKKHNPLRNSANTRTILPVSLLLTAALLSVSPAGIGQTAGVNQGGPAYVHAPAGLDPMPQQNSTQASSQVDQMRQAERRRRVAADTVKLVELSTQLKAEIDQSPKDQLSVDVMRKAAEIEKTAHDVKQWMAY